MHVKTKQMAIAGLLAAFSAVLVVISAVVESSSLFFIAAASFCVGIVIREWGVLFGGCFWAASVFVNFIAAPNKMYCITFAAMGLYLLLSEWLWEKIAAKENLKNRRRSLWIGKYVVFNCIYLPILIGFPNLIFTKAIEGAMFWIVVLAGQAALFVFDKAYNYFQAEIWGKLRNKVL